MRPSHSQPLRILRLLAGFVLYLTWGGFQTTACWAAKEPSPCPPLLVNAINVAIQASATGYPTYVIIRDHAVRTATMYAEVPGDAQSRAQARQKHALYEQSQVQLLKSFGRSAALQELESLICDRYGNLANRRSAVRLWLLMKGYEETESAVSEMGRDIARGLLTGTDSSDDRILLHDLWLGLRELPDVFAKYQLVCLLNILLKWDSEKTHFLSPHARDYRNSLLSTILADANADQFEQLTAQVLMLPQPTQLKIVVDIAHILDALLDKEHNQAKLTADVMRTLMPALSEAILWIGTYRRITLSSKSLPESLEWNDDLGMLVGMIHLVATRSSRDPMHPGHFFALLTQHNWDGPLTPAQRFLIRNYCQSIAVARLDIQALAEVQPSMERTLELLLNAALALPPFKIETESVSPSEYTDIRLLVKVFPWSLYTAERRRALLAPLLEEAKYGGELASIAREILSRP